MTPTYRDSEHLSVLFESVSLEGQVLEKGEITFTKWVVNYLFRIMNLCDSWNAGFPIGEYTVSEKSLCQYSKLDLVDKVTSIIFI